MSKSIQNPIDIVLTYVDNSDPVWQAEYSKFNVDVSDRRYRSWDNLKYWFRGIERNMPFIRTIHMVVSNIEQVPEWLNQEKIHIILHKDIIPQEFLPTFNSTTIEMFLPFIEGLSEKFIYFNDDMFVMNPCTEEDFFSNGKPIYSLIHRKHAINTFRNQCRNSYRLAMRASGFKDERRNHYFYIRHSADPMLRSDALELWKKEGESILGSLTKFREPWNMTQYLFPDYSIMKGNWVEGEFNFKYLKMRNLEDVLKEIKFGVCKCICINDTEVDGFESQKEMINDIFSDRFTNKSCFEL